MEKNGSEKSYEGRAGYQARGSVVYSKHLTTAVPETEPGRGEPSHVHHLYFFLQGKSEKIRLVGYAKFRTCTWQNQ